MTRTLLVLGILALIALSYFGMLRAWRARVASQAAIAEPAAPSGARAVAGPWTGRYLGATRAGEWLARVDAHSLGERSLASVRITPTGIDVVRANTRSFGIPFGDLVGVRADKAIAGRAYEDGGIVVVTFRLGNEPIDIGFRFPDTAEHLAAIRAIAQHSEGAK